MHPTSLIGRAPALDVPGTMGQHIYTEAQTALTVVYNTLGEIKDVRAQVEKTNQTKREGVQGGKIVRLVAYPDSFFDGVDRAFTRASRQVDAADAGISAKIASINTRVDTMLRDPTVNTPLAVEIRAHAKSLTESRRVAFIQEAAKGKDRATLAALLAGPAYLSGMSKEQADLARALAEEAFAPQESAQLRAARVVLDRVRDAGSALVAYYGEVVALRDSPASRARRAIDKLGA
jgi:hypothetical protein